MRLRSLERAFQAFAEQQDQHGKRIGELTEGQRRQDQRVDALFTLMWSHWSAPQRHGARGDQRRPYDVESFGETARELFPALAVPGPLALAPCCVVEHATEPIQDLLGSPTVGEAEGGARGSR